MGAGSGPYIIKQGLVFGVDMYGYHRYNPGEPTTNLITPSTNSYPTSGNGWGTYNTNQYNNNTYFSIGTIDNITNNIIFTTTSHPLRSYDVVTPQSSGGGVTAGVNYLVKKLSSTSFSLHSYNSSQDGSQGYINYSTGNFKVYDDFAQDIKISVANSGFPTMWWGPPHLPNSGLVKEIITSGFVNPITGEINDCIRQHLHREDGVVDNMAYGVDASFTSNVDVTCSFWARAVDSNAVSKSINFYHYTYNVTSPTAYSMNAVLGPVGEWRRYSYTWNSPNNRAISYWFNPSGPFKYDIANIQIEQKSHATRFTTGTRTSTQSILDIARKVSLDVSNVSFDSNAYIVFDGTNDYFDIPNTSLISGTQDFTIESVYNMTGQNGGAIFVNYGTSYTTNAIWFSGQYGLYLNTGCYVPGAPLSNGKYHMVATRLSGTVKLYLNGVEVNSAVLNASVASNINYRVGADVNGAAEPFTGTIYTVRVYDRALSATEVFQNYQGYKLRFNL